MEKSKIQSDILDSMTNQEAKVDKRHGILALLTTHVNSAASFYGTRSGQKKVKKS